MPTKGSLSITRRKALLQTAGMTAYSAAILNLPRSLAESLADESRGAPQTSIPIPRRRAQIFALDEVRLESGPYREAMERDRKSVV